MDASVKVGLQVERKRRLCIHVGDHNSFHNRCSKACQNLLNQQHIEVSLAKWSAQFQNDYWLTLFALHLLLEFTIC